MTRAIVPRLRTLLVPERTDAEILTSLAKRLRKSASKRARIEAAEFIELLVESGFLDTKVIKQVGAPPDLYFYEAATAYVVRKMMLGKGKAKVAHSDVAKLFPARNGKPGTNRVEQAIALAKRAGNSGTWRVEQELLRNVGKAAVETVENGKTETIFWTRKNVLEAMWLDFVDAAAAGKYSGK